MNILYISNDYAGSKVHSNLTKALDNLNVQQTVYCPVRDQNLMGNNQFEGKNVDFIYSFCIKSWYKYVYQYKRWVLYKDIKRHIKLNKFDIIHAPTLFSDGGLALKAYKEYGIPYVVAVRNTDINVFVRKLKHTHYIGREIALCAKKIFFPSKGLMNEFLKSDFIRPIWDQIKDKIEYLPNGIDNYWLQNINHDPRKGHTILYIGDFTPNKNVHRLVQAIIQLRKKSEYSDLKLVIVGGGKDKNKLTENLIKSHPEFIEYLGKIYEKKKLSEIMRNCSIFAMPSIHETFGLVYIEALSQNLPVIYSKSQGIDGIFDNTIGEKVNALSVDEICMAIQNILKTPQKYGNKNVIFEDFDWDRIAQKYIKCYNESI